MKKLIALAILGFSTAANAGGWTTANGHVGNVEFIEIVRAQGFLIKGDFHDAAGCNKGGYLWVDIAHPQYEQVYATALAAFMGGKKINAYASTCTAIGWHGGQYNTLTGSGALYLLN